MVRPVAEDESGAMDNPSPTATDGQPPPPSGPRVTRDEMLDLGRLRRSVTDRNIAGVAGGLARHLDVDPIIVRVALVVAVFFGGAGLLAYIGAWVLVPEEGTDDEPLGLESRSRSLALAGVGILALLVAVGDWAGAFWFPWPLAILAALVVWFLNRKDRATTPRSGESSAPTAWEVPASYGRDPRPARNPRRRGPILFLFTLALIALAEGVLGVADLAGVPTADGAYPALALGIIAVLLVIGSFWGRAGGLIALGVVAALVTAAATVVDEVPEDRWSYAPTSAAEVRDSYDLGGGELTLDLSGVTDIEALDGRDIAIDGVGGRLEVVVPDGMDVGVRTEVVAGDSRVFDRRGDGFDVSVDAFRDAGPGVPDMSITVDLVVGEIIVREAA